jgi:hypothetical protein
MQGVGWCTVFYLLKYFYKLNRFEKKNQDAESLSTSLIIFFLNILNNIITIKIIIIIVAGQEGRISVITFNITLGDCAYQVGLDGGLLNLIRQRLNTA